MGIPSAYEGTPELAEAIGRSFTGSSSTEGFSMTNIHVVDLADGFQNSMFYDGIHPNADGEKFMADRWFPAVVDSCIVGGTSASHASGSNSSPTKKSKRGKKSKKASKKRKTRKKRKEASS